MTALSKSPRQLKHLGQICSCPHAKTPCSGTDNSQLWHTSWVIATSFRFVHEIRMEPEVNLRDSRSRHANRLPARDRFRPTTSWCHAHIAFIIQDE